MSRLSYRELTPMQREEICNGCGMKGMFFKPPDFLFHASCNQHDFHYWRGRGGSFAEKRADRLKADDQFYAAMLRDVKDLNLSESVSKDFRNVARAYYKAVRWFGWMAYNWGTEKGRMDLP